ncbi:hypothetical protein GMDG_06329 [Pseudogymnoascus destructans 20631-21]|uniref:Retrotransposon gag domain-containing protein n=1 Tax=Pseudogymnoascus destructans (strain ATCC MYA-4855 / 20631-21) TaxID=658429 RepID=L8FT00_PSED2|nr:hypothetical protein GMDG_06329 [Pseudogymnoascus destructans 20631-21]
MPPRQTCREVAASLERERSGVAALENAPEESGASSSLSQAHSSPGVEAQLATALALEAELQRELELREAGERIRRLQERLERVGQEEAYPHTLRSDERSVMTTVSSTSHAGGYSDLGPPFTSYRLGTYEMVLWDSLTSTTVTKPATWLEGEPRDAWLRHKKEPNFQKTWKEFKRFLLYLVQDPVNRTISTAIKYEEARQRSGQSAQAFATYLETLEAELPAYSEEHRVQHLLMKLRPEVQRKVLQYTEIPRSRGALIVLTGCFEQTEAARPRESAGKREEKPQGKCDRSYKRLAEGSGENRGASRPFPKHARLSDAEELR